MLDEQNNSTLHSLKGKAWLRHIRQRGGGVDYYHLFPKAPPGYVRLKKMWWGGVQLFNTTASYMLYFHRRTISKRENELQQTMECLISFAARYANVLYMNRRNPLGVTPKNKKMPTSETSHRVSRGERALRVSTIPREYTGLPYAHGPY